MGGRLDPDVARARSLVRAGLTRLATGGTATRGTVLVACSGGADSLALAVAATFVAPKLGIRVGATVVDHQLQPGSAQVAARAVEQLQGLGLDPVDPVRSEVRGPGGPEGAARRARYEALSRSAESNQAAAVLLGHTLDDQAETVLLGLGRGSGPRSIAGMAPVDGIWHRPLLTMTRAQTRQVCMASGLQPWQDPHNQDPAYARVRLRTHALPALEAALGPGVAAALARTADLMRADADLLDELAGRAFADAVDERGSMEVRTLAGLPGALRTRVIRSAALAAGCPASDLTAGHVLEIE